MSPGGGSGGGPALLCPPPPGAVPRPRGIPDSPSLRSSAPFFQDPPSPSGCASRPAPPIGVPAADPLPPLHLCLACRRPAPIPRAECPGLRWYRTAPNSAASETPLSAGVPRSTVVGAARPGDPSPSPPQSALLPVHVAAGTTVCQSVLT